MAYQNCHELDMLLQEKIDNPIGGEVAEFLLPGTPTSFEINISRPLTEYQQDSFISIGSQYVSIDLLTGELGAINSNQTFSNNCIDDALLLEINDQINNTFFCEKVPLEPEEDYFCTMVYEYPEFAINFESTDRLTFNYESEPRLCQQHDYTVCTEDLERFRSFHFDLKEHIRSCLQAAATQ